MDGIPRKCMFQKMTNYISLSRIYLSCFIFILLFFKLESLLHDLL